MTLTLASYAAFQMVPATLSASARHAYMMEAADEYAATRWLDVVTPPRAVLLAELRAAALLPRPFVSWDARAGWR